MLLGLERHHQEHQCFLSPNSDAFSTNVKPFNWRHVVNTDPPTLDPLHFGWTNYETTKTLGPVILPKNVRIASEVVLK